MFKVAILQKCAIHAQIDKNIESIMWFRRYMEAIREYRNREMLGNTFRKVEAYSQLLSKEIKKPFIRDGQNR